MPVSLCEWRVRIGRFVHSVREYIIRERKEKLLKERIRRLKLLHKRLLEKKEKAEDKCGSKQDDLCAKLNNASNDYSIINTDCRNRSESTIKENTAQTESTTNHKSNGDDSTFPFFFILMLSLFSILFSLIFFFVVDLSNLLDCSKPFLNRGGESTRSTCLRIIVCSSLAYIVLSCVINNNEDMPSKLELVGDENGKVECINKKNKSPSESTKGANNTSTGTIMKSHKSQTASNIKENNTDTESVIKENSPPTKSIIKMDNTLAESKLKYNNSPTNFTIKDDNSTSESSIKDKNTPTKSTTKRKNTPTESQIKGKNTTTESTKECNYTPPNATIKESNALFTIRDGPSERKTSKTTTPQKNTIKQKITKTKFSIRENSTLTESTVKGSVTRTERHIEDSNTLSTMTDKPSTRKITRKTLTPKRKSTMKKTIKEKTATETTIRAKNCPNESDSKDNNTPSESTINKNNTKTEFALKESSTPSSIIYKFVKRKRERRKRAKRKTVRDKNIATESKMKGNTTITGSTFKETGASTESTIKDNNTPTESTIEDYSTPTKSSIKDNSSPTESSNESNDHSSESTIKDNNTPIESTITDNTSPIESTIKDNKTSIESTIKDNKTPIESTIKDNKTPIESTIKDNKTPIESTIKDCSNRIELNIKHNNSTIQSTNKRNNTTPESAKKDSNSKKENAIKDSNTPTKSTIEENDAATTSTAKYNDNSNESPVKTNNSGGESTKKESSTTNISAFEEKNFPSRTPTEEKNNQPMKVNSVQAQYTIGSGTQKVLSDGKQGISSQVPGSLEVMPADPVKEDGACLPEMLLVKAGDVELNPGPFDRSANIQEQELVNLAYDISPSKYTELCIALGVSYTQSQVILDRHRGNVTGSLIEIFCEWKIRQRDGTDCRNGIAAALRGVNLDALGDKFSRGGYLQQEAALTASIANEKDPLTAEQVTRCGDDLKTFYRTRLCKIKTDPLDFSLVLEFESIYTDLVLLRNEHGMTRKIPLDFKELLKTKVNGELPKRLMVEGEGGAGKTTFCSKMAWDWTNGADEFKEFVWVLVIPLRDIETNQTVGDITKTYLSDSNSVQPHQIDEYILANPSKIFIIFDGLDEYDGDLVKQENDIAKIIRSEKFRECRVLVTTRPWKADQIKSNAIFMRTYAFIAVAGFDKIHISIYINKYFSDDSQAGRDLIKFIEDNDVIQENMAPFPIYIAMLCTLWRDSDSKKRELIQRLKTFSQLFKEIITFLKEHHVSKQFTDLDTEAATQFYEQLSLLFEQIGKIALSGIVDKKFVYVKNDFSSCKEAMRTCCRVGVLSKENRLVPRRDRRKNTTLPVTVNVFFPHKLFQEYLAGMYLASLFESDQEQYETAINDVIPKAKEFRYLLYFTSSQSKNVAIDVTNRLINMRNYSTERHFLVDIAFEAYDEDSARVVGQHLFAEQKSLEIDDEMSAHTVSGYLFIMDNITMETLILSRTSCGPTVSRDLADVICSSTALTALELRGTAFHDDFYGILESKVKASKIERLTLQWMEISEEHASRNLARFLNILPRLRDLTLRDNRFGGRFYRELASGPCSVEVGASGHSIRKLHLDHRCHNDVLQHGFTVKMLFPNLEHLRFTTLQTLSPCVVRSLAHSGIKELSFGPLDEDDYEPTENDLLEDEEYHVSLVGDPSSLEQVFSNPFPLLTSLTFHNLVIGNNRCRVILSFLKKHQHLKNLCFVHCYTDEELDPIVSAMNMENRMKVNIQHDQAQKRLECMKMSSSLADALCQRTSIQDLILMEDSIFPNDWFSDENQRTVDSKVQKLSLRGCTLDRKDPSASRDLARFLCLQPCLIDLTIWHNDTGYRPTRLHDEFYHELARLASSSKVHKLSIGVRTLWSNDPSASRALARFLCLQRCLINLTIGHSDTTYGQTCLHNEFYHELVLLASSSKVQKLSIKALLVERNDPSASRDLARFLCLQPCLIDLTIGLNDTGFGPTCLHDKFYHELALLASSSKVQKLSIGVNTLESNDPSASRDLAGFLCLQPCLIDLTIGLQDTNYGLTRLHDKFYHELALLASSSKVQKLYIGVRTLGSNDPSASRDLARFLCLQRCLINLTIGHSDTTYGPTCLHDEFYHELALLASSSKIEKLCINCNLENNDSTASRALAKFLCRLTFLTDLTMKDSSKLRVHDDFYHEISLLASFSKSRFFRENLHRKMWSAELQQLQQTQKQQQQQQLRALAHLETSGVLLSELDSTDEPTKELNEECAPGDRSSSFLSFSLSDGIPLSPWITSPFYLTSEDSYETDYSVLIEPGTEEVITYQGVIDEDQSSPPRKRRNKTDRDAP